MDVNRFTEEVAINEEKMVRSKRRLERQSKRRKVPKKPENAVYEVSGPMIVDLKKKLQKALNTDDPFRLFLWGPETKQLLTVKEEKDLFLNIQACLHSLSLFYLILCI